MLESIPGLLKNEQSKDKGKHTKKHQKKIELKLTDWYISHSNVQNTQMIIDISHRRK